MLLSELFFYLAFLFYIKKEYYGADVSNFEGGGRMARFFVGRF